MWCQDVKTYLGLPVDHSTHSLAHSRGVPKLVMRWQLRTAFPKAHQQLLPRGQLPEAVQAAVPAQRREVVREWVRLAVGAARRRWLLASSHCLLRPAHATPAPALRAAVVFSVPRSEPIHSFSVLLRFKCQPIKDYTPSLALLEIDATDVEGSEHIHGQPCACARP